MTVLPVLSEKQQQQLLTRILFLSPKKKIQSVS
jgi:hypothetical protein